MENPQIHQFNESRAEFSGFSAFYHETIFPKLAAKEGERQLVNRKVFTAVCGLAVLYLALAFLIVYQVKKPRFLIFITFAFIPILLGVVYYMQRKLKAGTKEHLMQSITRFLGWSYQLSGFLPPELDLLKRHKMLPSWDRKSLEDEMRGTAHGADFRLCEAHLEREDNSDDGDNWTTVFRGVILEIDFHREFLGRTVVLRDKSIFNRRKFEGMKRVGLVDPVFEKAFEAYGTDQVEARYLLTPDFMQRLVDLEKKFDGKQLRFGFLRNRLHIVVDAPNQFEAGSMFEPLTAPGRTQKILNEIDAIFAVIDGLVKPQTSVRQQF